MMSDFEVCLGESESPSDFYVKFHAPKDSPLPHRTETPQRQRETTTSATSHTLLVRLVRLVPVSSVPVPSGLYEGGIYRVHVTLPAAYPYKSPSIGFQTKIFHPNVDESSGSVCLDVINQTWSPMYDLVNIFSVFLPQLLLYPNPADPLNGQAAASMFREPEAYKQKIREHVKKHAMVDFKLQEEEDDDDEDDDAADEDDAVEDAADDDAAPMSDPDDEIMSDLDEMPTAEDGGIQAEA